MDGRVGHPHGPRHSVGDEQPHADGEDTRDGEVAALFQPVDATQHEDGVDEHDHPAGDHLDPVEEDGGGGHVAEAVELFEEKRKVCKGQICSFGSVLSVPSGDVDVNPDSRLRERLEGGVRHDFDDLSLPGQVELVC